jgi:hypothetical protein
MKLAREDLLSFACDDQERIIARHIPEAAIEHLSRFSTREERQFAFRCFWVPYEMVGVCEKAFSSPKGRVLFVWQFGLLIAHSRMLKEMCAWGQDPRASWWYPSAAAKACRWWMQRYDSYREAIDCAYGYWMKRKCPDCCHEQPDLAAASRYGFVQRVDVQGLPSKILGELLAGMKEREQKASRESEFFLKNAKGTSEPRWVYPDIDLWLIEVWPLVKQYGWTYKEVCDLAFSKFGGDNTMVNVSVLNNSKALKERCQDELGLHLSSIAQERHGRPKKSDDTAGPSYVGENVWEEVAKRTEHPDPEIQKRGKTAFQALAEIAVNMEPFSSMIEGRSKELFSVACPNLKMGGKKTDSAPPFFVQPTL